MADFGTLDAIQALGLVEQKDSVFGHVTQAPPITVFKLKDDYVADTNPDKINLGVGAYRTGEGKPWPLPVVKAAEKLIVADESLNKEYLPSTGLPEFVTASIKLLLGDDHKAITENRTTGVQSISGTGALMLAAHFLRNFYGDRENTPVYVSKETWGNHRDIFKRAGFNDLRNYSYWEQNSLNLNIDGLLEDLNSAPQGSIVILHGCAHNPTGCDPTRKQWVEIFKIVISRKLFPIFDNAYQGFASGDPSYDAWAIRLFAETGCEAFVTQSYAKNFGLYNERVGCLAMVGRSADILNKMKSQIVLIVRQLYSNPPVHGARIVATVLNTPELYDQWRENIKTMSTRILAMRDLLRSELEQLDSERSWQHITTQIGMFSFTGLNKNQCEWMKAEKSIYLLNTGRISMAGVNESNVQYLAKGMVDSFEHM